MEVILLFGVYYKVLLWGRRDGVGKGRRWRKENKGIKKERSELIYKYYFFVVYILYLNFFLFGLFVCGK